MNAPLAPRPAVIFFDVGDTLLRVDPSWAAIYRRAGREFGLEIDEVALEEAFRRIAGGGVADNSGPYEATQEGSYQRVKRFDERVMAALGEEGVPDRFYRRLGELFLEAEAWHVFPEVRAVLDALADRGMRCAVVSNWVWGLPQLLHDLELAQHFEHVVVSSRIGYDKPHPAIFRHALALAGVSAAEALHVGDNPATDVAGARAAGIRAVLVRRRPGEAGRRDEDPGLAGVPVIGDLRDLLPLLGLAEGDALRHGLARGVA